MKKDTEEALKVGGLVLLTYLIVNSMKAATPTQTIHEYNVANKASVNSNVRAVRNLNPGNVRHSGDAWQGMTGQDDKGFCQFNTADNGTRCMVKLLRNYSANRGLDTIKTVIDRYAPSSENDTNSYVKVIASRMGLPETQGLNLKTDANNLASLAYYMHIHEAGFAWVEYDVFLKWAKEFTK